MRGRRCAGLVVVGVAWSALAGGGALSAQEAMPDQAASPLIEIEHWVYDAVRRLDGAGLTPADFDRGMWLLDRARAVALVDMAADRAQREGSPLVGLIRGWSERLRAEYPVAAARVEHDAGSMAVGRGVVGAGYRSRDGVVLTGVGAPPTLQEDPREAPDVGTAVAGLDLSGYGGSRWAARLQVVADAQGLELGQSQVLVDLGPVRFWGGRRQVQLGAGTSALVLKTRQPADGVGLELEPTRLPWILDVLGPVRVKMTLIRLGDVAPFEHPWLWVMRASATPHPRFTIGLNRSAMVAATDQSDREFLKQLAYVLIGKHPDGELNRHDNQIAAFDLLYRPPLGGLPLSLYLEWGLEDSAGSWRDVPGVVVGAELAALPGLPAVGLGVEHASFARMCCGNPWWYRHRGFAGGWTDEREPLGHALGGHGREWAMTGVASIGTGLIELSTRLYDRDRHSENLFAPLLEGESRGASIEAEAVLGRSVRLILEAEYERGEDWTRHGLELITRLQF